MTRRDLFKTAALITPDARIEIPVKRLIDRNARCTPAQLAKFYSTVWDEAVRCFAKGGILIRAEPAETAMSKHPSGKPRFTCLDPGRINVVLTDRVPLDWDKGRSLAGVSAMYEGFCVCVISMNEAHGNQLPFVSLNTVLHELLHVLLLDVFTAHEGAFHGQDREAHVDLTATRLWLFGDGSSVRQSARECLKRLATNREQTVTREPCASG